MYAAHRKMSDGSNFSCHLHDGAHVLVTKSTPKGSQSSDKWKLQKWSEMTNFEIKIQSNICVCVCVCAVNIKCSLRLAHTQPAQKYECVCVCVCTPVSVVVRKLSTSHAQTRTSTPQDRGGRGQSGLLAVASVSGTHTDSQSLRYGMVRKTAERRVQSADDLPAWVCHM